MNDGSYDEEIVDNVFFVQLQSKHKKLFDSAQDSRYVICVPKDGSVTVPDLELVDFEAHILKWSDNEIVSTNGWRVSVDGQFLITQDGYPESRKAQILFEETFYNHKDESYRVLCIDIPLVSECVQAPEALQLNDLRDCIHFLWAARYDRKVHTKIDSVVHQFCRNVADETKHRPGHTRADDAAAKHKLVEMATVVFTRSKQLLLRESTHRKPARASRRHQQAMLRALENYTLDLMHPVLWQQCAAALAPRDSQFNRMTRNLSHISEADLQLHGMSRGITQNMAYALKLVAEINDKTTVTEKLQCIQQAVTCITDGATVAVSADELVPLLALVVLRSDIPNWLANIHYMKSFQLARLLPEHLAYLLVSLEAAVTHILNNGLDGIAWCARLPPVPSSGDPVPPLPMVQTGTTTHKVPPPGTNQPDATPHPTGGATPDSSTSNDRAPDTSTERRVAVDGSVSADVNDTAVQPQGSSGVGYYSAGEDSDVSPQMQRARHGSGLELFGTPLGSPERQCSDSNTHDNDHVHDGNLDDDQTAPAPANETPSLRALTPTHNGGVVTPSPLDVTPPTTPSAVPGSTSEAAEVARVARAQSAQQRSIVKRFLADVGAGDVFRVREGLETAKAVFDESKLCHPLCECQRCHDLRVAFEYKQRAVSVHMVDADGCRAIHIAARLGNVDVLTLLIEKKSPIDAYDVTEQTPLHYACQRDRIGCVLVLLNHGADINRCDTAGRTALHFCAINGHERCAKAIVFHAPATLRMDARDINGNTALHLAAKWGYAPLVELLLLSGADRTVANARGQTPMMLAHSHEITSVFQRPSVTELALPAGTDDASSVSSATTQTVPIMPSSHDANDNKLLAPRTKSQSTPASRIGSDSDTNPDTTMQTTVGTRTNQVPPRGITRTTAQSFHSPAARRTKTSPPPHVPPDVANGDGNHFTVRSVDRLAVKDAQSAQAPGRRWRRASWFGGNTSGMSSPTGGGLGSKRQNNPALLAHDLETFFNAIVDGDDTFVRKAIAERGGTVSPVVSVEQEVRTPPAAGSSKCHPLCQCSACSRQRRKLLSSSTALDLVTKCNAKGETALHMASLHGRSTLIRLLVENGGYVGAPTRNRVTPLHCAAQYNHHDTVKQLLIHNACPDTVDDNGNTPLHFCAANGHHSCASLLLTGMLMVDAQNVRGDTALHNATRWGYTRMVEMLLDEGTSTNVVNKRGMSPAALAVGKPCETLFSSPGSANVSTEIILSNVPPPCAHINGLYKQTGMLPRAWSAHTRGARLTGDDRLPVFRHAGAMGHSDTPPAATPASLAASPVMYYDGGLEAWVVARRLGCADVLARSSSRADHPAVSSAAWSVRDDNGAFHVDIDVDVVGTEVGEPLATAFVDIDPGSISTSPPAPTEGGAGGAPTGVQDATPVRKPYVQAFTTAALQRYGGGEALRLASDDGHTTEQDGSPVRPGTLRDVDGVLASPVTSRSPGRAHPPPPALNMSLFDSPVSPPSPATAMKPSRILSATDSLFTDTFGDDTWGQPPEMSPNDAVTPSDVRMMSKLQSLPSFTAPLSSARVAFARDNTSDGSRPGAGPATMPVFGAAKYNTYGGAAEQTSPADDSGEYTPPLSDVEGTLED
eukprot:m.20474 g.20474  ORF g.20474 m.20474 type:complete len:1613 (-) comp12157_c0_seq1:326-5164(-)